MNNVYFYSKPASQCWDIQVAAKNHVLCKEWHKDWCKNVHIFQFRTHNVSPWVSHKTFMEYHVQPSSCLIWAMLDRIHFNLLNLKSTLHCAVKTAPDTCGQLYKLRSRTKHGVLTLLRRSHSYFYYTLNEYNSAGRGLFCCPPPLPLVCCNYHANCHCRDWRASGFH